MKAQFRLQEEDRSYLIKQLVAVKKDNMKMRSEIESLENKIADHQEEIDRLQVSRHRLTVRPIRLVSQAICIRHMCQ